MAVQEVPGGGENTEKKEFRTAAAYYQASEAYEAAENLSMMHDTAVSIFSDGHKYTIAPSALHSKFVLENDGCVFLYQTHHSSPPHGKSAVQEIENKAALIRAAVKAVHQPLPEADPRTLTGKAKDAILRIRRQGRLGSLTLIEFRDIELSVYALQRDGEAETISSKARFWFKKLGFTIETKDIGYKILDPPAKIPDYYGKLERFFADKMAGEYKTRTVFEQRRPHNCLKTGGIVLSQVDEYYKYDMLKILKDKGAVDLQSTVKILDDMISNGLTRREKALAFLL
jgi:hypothetical protein